MSVATISQTYTFFRNFIKFDGKEETLQKKLKGYNYTVSKEKLPDGSIANIHRFVNANKAITIRAYRIDFEYGYNSPDCSTAEFISFVEKSAKQISSVIKLKGQRIAYSNVEFVEDVKGAVKSKACKLFNISRVFGSNSDEIHVRLNHKTEINGEIYNSVLDIQDGTVTNKQTNVKTVAMFINKDINTLVDNREERFDLMETSKYLSNMVHEADERTKKLVKKLGVR